MNIYKKLRKLKNDQNGKPLSMRALEKEIGINHAHISEIETGKRLPSINEMDCTPGKVITGIRFLWQ